MVTLPPRFAGFGLLPEISSGAHERMLATPASRASLLLGRITQDVALMLVQSVLVLLPMDLVPGWLYTLSRLNPLAHVVDAERALFAGQWGTDVAVGWVVALVLVLSRVIGARMVRRGSS